MASDHLGILWRGNRDARNQATAENNRLRPVFEALAGLDVAAEPVVYSDEFVEEVRNQLQQLDGILVWVDPITDGQNRSRLDALLREVASTGVWVSAHPDVILKMGTKEVLFRTRDVGWGSDTHLYNTARELMEQLPSRLAAGPRVLKQSRGNGGIGVWKVEVQPGATVRVQHARDRDGVTEDLPLSEFIDRCEEYFSGTGCMVDQPFQPRIVDGMIRCYLTQDKVAGFAHQYPSHALPPETVLGLPAQKTMYGPAEPRFKALRASMESDWVPASQRLLNIETNSLPAVWDADFLYGPKNEHGEDTYVLCEINVSSVYPFPEEAVGQIAQTATTCMLQAKKTRVNLSTT
jgi:hypothetical protein